MTSSEELYPRRVDVEQIIGTYRGYLARAHSAAPFSSESSSVRFAPGPRTVGYYKRYLLDGEKRWVIAFEDDRLGDWLCVDPNNAQVPNLRSVPASSHLLIQLQLPDHLATQLEHRPRSFVRPSSWPPDVTNLDLIAAWLQHADADSIPYGDFMALWQFFDMLPSDLDLPMADRQWLACAVYQHLWIGIYAERINVRIPHWDAGELALLAERLHRGVDYFRAHTYAAD